MKFTFGLLLTTASLFALTNLEIAKKADEATNGFVSSVAQTKMVLINASGQKSIRDLKMKTLEGEDADKTLSEFLSPADIKGTKTLTHGHIDKSDDQWLYLPALKRVKRISSKNKSGSFMGSEFSYEDIGNQNYKKFTYKDKVEVVPCGKLKCYKGERIPKDKNSGYTKQVTFVDTKGFILRQVDYYDRKSEHLKTAIFSEYKKKGSVYRVGKIAMSNYQNDKKTTITWIEDNINAGLKSKDFSKRKLKK